MSNRNRLMLLALLVMTLAFYSLLNWTSSSPGTLTFFRGLKPSRPGEVAPANRADKPSFPVEKSPGTAGALNKGLREDVSQDGGGHGFIERQTSTQGQLSTTSDQSVEKKTNLYTDCDKPSPGVGFDELLRRYRSCMGNLVTLAQKEGKGRSKSPEDKAHSKTQTMADGLGLLSSNQWQEVAGRLASVKKGCRIPAVEFTKAPALRNIIFDQTHHLAYCRHGKAGTTSLISYLLSLNDIDPTTMTGHQLHQRVYQYLPVPTEENQKDILRNSFTFTSVRHPFRRFVSAYCNKEVENNYEILDKNIQAMSSEGREKELLKYKYRVGLGDTEPTAMVGPWIRRVSTNRNQPGGRTNDDSLLAHYLSNINMTQQKENLNEHAVDDRNQSIYTADEDETETLSKEAEADPFRSFVHGVVLTLLMCESDPNCLSQTDLHIRPQVIRWNPCVLNFDMVMKVETLDRDIELMQELLGLSNPRVVEEEEVAGDRGSVVRSEETPEDSLILEKIQKSQRRKRALDQKNNLKETRNRYSENTSDGTVQVENTVGKSTLDPNGKLEGDSGQPTDSGDPHGNSGEKPAGFRPEDSSEYYGDTGFFRRNTSGKKCETYEEYMRQLSQRDFDLLYTSYYLDFKLFDYDPFE